MKLKSQCKNLKKENRIKKEKKRGKIPSFSVSEKDGDDLCYR